METKSYRLRYIVPFSYSYEESEKAYTHTGEALLNSGHWKVDEKESGDLDSYAYMNELYAWEKDGELCDTSIGSMWQYRNKSVNLRFRYAEEEKRQVEAVFKRAGIYLLKSKVGLFWYEIELEAYEKERYGKIENIKIDTLITFQNDFKELARREIMCHSDEAKSYDILADAVQLVGEDEIDNQDGYIHCKTKDKGVFAKIKKETVAYLENNSGEVTFEKIVPQKKEHLRRLEYNVKSEKKIGEWIKEILGETDCKIQFYPERKGCIPDKAILYQCVVSDVDNATREDMAYYLTNGYVRTYKKPGLVVERMYSPFENITWYAEKEGCGVYISAGEDDAFAADAMPQKVMGEYFFFYMNVLQQSYTILHMAEEIATMVSVATSEYESGNSKVSKKLEELQLRINMFLVKSMHASVSHIGHHNTFYQYIEERLRIKEEIEALKEGLDSVEEIQRRHEEDKLTIGLAVLSVFAIISIFKDINEVIKIFSELQVVSWSDIIPYALVTLICVFVVIVLRESLGKLFEIFWKDIKYGWRALKKAVRRVTKKNV